MGATRGPVVGFLLVAAGFAWWGMRAASIGEGVYVWMNVIRVAAALLAAVGVVLLARGGSPSLFRAGILGFLAAAVIALVYNVTSRIVLPEDLSTLFGFAGACAAAYGATHWFGRGDHLAAAWVAGGFALMAANPGTYILVGFYETLAAGAEAGQEGWLFGSLMACAGCILVARTVHGIVETRASGPTNRRRVGAARPAR